MKRAPRNLCGFLWITRRPGAYAFNGW